MMHGNISKGPHPSLLGPVLGAFDLGVLLQVGQHHDQLQAVLPYHAPEVVDGRVCGSLRADELFALLGVKMREIIASFFVF